MEIKIEKIIEVIKESTTMKEKESIVLGILNECSAWFFRTELPRILKQSNIDREKELELERQLIKNS